MVSTVTSSFGVLASRVYYQVKRRGLALWLLALIGAPSGARTLDLLIKSQLLLPAELRAHKQGSFYMSN